jgi:hypothetical protein
MKNTKPGFASYTDLVWLLVGVGFLGLLHVLPLGESAAKLLIDKHPSHPAGFFTVHSGIWLAFFVGLGRLISRWKVGREEEKELQEDYLPAESDEILTSADLGQIYKRLKDKPKYRFLPRLLERTVTQYQGNKSISHAHTLLDSCLDLYLHELDLNYHMIRYMVWLIPTLGFIGSVIGIGNALSVAGSTAANDPNLLSNTTSAMAIAFSGTFLALTLSAILVFIMHLAQSKEERALNASAQYCLDRLINRLYEEKAA